jgi:hypothetical protein
MIVYYLNFSKYDKLLIDKIVKALLTLEIIIMYYKMNQNF